MYRHNLKSPLPSSILLTLMLTPLLQPSAANASVATFTVDPTQSRLLLSGTYGSLDATQQSVYTVGFSQPLSSMECTYGGTITVSRDEASGGISITNGSISAENQFPWAPPLYVSTMADYGVIFESFTGNPVDIWAAIREFSFTLSSPLISTPSAFDASLLSATISSGQLRYVDGLIMPYSEILTPILGTFPFDSGTASLTSIAGIDTLSIPLQANFFSLSVDNVPMILRLTGTIVATVPEPSSIVILAAAVFIHSPRRRKRPDPF